ncbi:MAG: hypothetical protein NVSMB31_03660 [Vulcanimicrobiaceae bacterium]
MEIDQTQSLYAEARKVHDKGDFTALERLATELYDRAREGGDHIMMARAHNLLGTCAIYAVDGDKAERFYQSALEHFRAAGDRHGEAIIALNLGCIASDLHMDQIEARRQWEYSLGVFRENNDTLRTAIALANLGELNRLEGDYASAFAFGNESLALFQSLGDKVRIAWQRINIAHYRILRREYAEAIASLREAFQTLHDEENPEQISNYFETWFIMAVEMKRYTSAVRILGFLERYRIEHRVPRMPSAMPWFTPRYEKLEKAIYSGDFEHWRAEGAKMSLEEANQATFSILVPTA